ncbi:MAG: L,D-transpeptidase family protein [Verrucomicrobia bacterium]|nr:L,D-transpeptidase family protein [Verrucomicrobiota bacterium]
MKLNPMILRGALRTIILSTIAAGLPLAASAEVFTEGNQVPAATETLKAGDFVWEPERAPAGPVLLVVSVPEQVAHVYRNGVQIARSSVSTGRPGHPTPIGVFTVMEKEVKHESSIYKGAEMPYMERLTMGGIALHAGQLPGYPDSHGCVRLPLEFSKLLYGVTQKGITVIIADEHSAPRETVHPGMLFSPATPPAADTKLARGQFTWTPEKAPSGPVTIIISEPDQQVYAYRNGVEIGRTTVRNVAIRGLHVYSALDGVDAQGKRKWIRVDGKPAANDPNIAEMASKAGIADGFYAGLRSVVVPGTTLVFTDKPVNADTQSKPGFKVLGLGQVASR